MFVKLPINEYSEDDLIFPDIFPVILNKKNIRKVYIDERACFDDRSRLGKKLNEVTVIQLDNDDEMVTPLSVEEVFDFLGE